MTQLDTTTSSAASSIAPGGAGASAASTKERSKKAMLWSATACGVLVVAVLMISSRQPPAPQKLPDPVPSSRVVPIPGLVAHPPAPAAGKADAMTLPLSPREANTAPADAAIPPPVAESAVTPVVQTDSPASANDKQILDALQRNADALASVEQGIADLKAQLAKLTPVQQVPRRQARAGAAAAATRPLPARSTTDLDSAQLLSIDLWGGKPSVVVGRHRGDGTEVTFLNEGEKQERITVKRADVGTQRAVLATDRGDVVLSREE